ncbi:MAG TPA: hypothetical protein VEJ86_10250, partial [Candidatus Binataceae bacterium]|nr:hypothetical protein [Candidatus Binataceae bacterium]
ASSPGHPIAIFAGSYDSVSMSWLSLTSIAVALRARPQPSPAQPGAETPSSGEPPAAAPPRPSAGLQVVVVAGAGSVAPITLPGCQMSTLSWSVHGIYAVGEGDSVAPPVLIDRRHTTCREFPGRRPIQVLAWSANEEGSFLYTQPTVGGVPSVFKYDIDHDRNTLIAVSTSAATFLANGAIIAVGNQELRERQAASHPNDATIAQIALIDPSQSEVDLKTLGFATTPAMLARSSLTYTSETNRAAIESYSPAEPLPLRKILTYSVASENAFQAAFGPARGVVELSWSPKGRWLAIEDGDASHSAVTVLTPPG